MAHHFEFELSRDDVLLFELAAEIVSTWLLTDGTKPLLTLAFDPIGAEVVPIHVNRLRLDDDAPASSLRAPQLSTAESDRDIFVPARSALMAMTKRTGERGLVVIWVIGEYVHAAVLDDVPGSLIVGVHDAASIRRFVMSASDPIAERVRGAAAHLVLRVDESDDEVREEQTREAHRTKKAVFQHFGAPIAVVARISAPPTSMAGLRELHELARENVERLLGAGPGVGAVGTSGDHVSNTRGLVQARTTSVRG